MRAAHVVRLDLEARDRIRPRPLREEEVPVRLVRVRALRVLVHLDQPLVHHARAVAEGALEEEVARRVAHVVILEGVEIEVLGSVSEIAPGELGLGALPVEVHLEVELGELSAERRVGPVELAVPGNAHALGAEVMDVPRPALEGGQVEGSARSHRDLGRADVDADARLPVRDVLLDDRGLSPFAQSHHHVREGPEVGSLAGDQDLDGPRDRNPVRHVDERAAAQESRRERREAALVGPHRAPEELLHQGGMLPRRVRDRHHQDAVLLKLGVALDQHHARVQLHQERRALFLGPDLKAQRSRKLGDRAHDRMGITAREDLIPLERADVGPSPQLLGARGEWRLLAIRPRGRAAPGEEFGLLGPLGPFGDLV